MGGEVFTACQPNLPPYLFLLQLLYQRACLNAIFLYFSPFKYMYMICSAKSVLFTQISNSYLLCWNKLKFPSKNWMCCTQGVTNINMAELPIMPLTLDDSHSGRFDDFHEISWQKWGEVFTACQPILPPDLFLLQLLYQRACCNAIFLYFSPFKFMYTIHSKKSVLFTQISNSILRWNKLIFPSKNWMCCAQSVTNINMAELPIMPDGSHSGRLDDFHQVCWQKWRGISNGRFTNCLPNLPPDLFLLQLLYQRACFNAIFLYFSPFKYMYTIHSTKSVLFTQISNSYLLCWKQLKFPNKTACAVPKVLQISLWLNYP